MPKFYITEKQDLSSYREGEWIEAKNLSDAKRKASRNQVFQGTVLTIGYDEKTEVSYKKWNEKWVDDERPGWNENENF